MNDTNRMSELPWNVSLLPWVEKESIIQNIIFWENVWNFIKQCKNANECVLHIVDIPSEWENRNIPLWVNWQIGQVSITKYEAPSWWYFMSYENNNPNTDKWSWSQIFDKNFIDQYNLLDIIPHTITIKKIIADWKYNDIFELLWQNFGWYYNWKDILDMWNCVSIRAKDIDWQLWVYKIYKDGKAIFIADWPRDMASIVYLILKV